MTKKEIIDIEKMNYGSIILYREGAFWIAYERSAYWFFHNVRKYKPTRKAVQAAGGEIISLGFPDQGWAQITPTVQFLEKTADKIVLSTTIKERTLDEFQYKFDEWKKSFDLPTNAKRTAAHENLPVYKATYDLTLKVFQMSQHLKRDFRYTLGERIKNELMDLLTAVFSANVAEEKLPHITEARRLIEVIRLKLRLLKDLGQIAIKNMAAINLDIEEISKQLNAWQNATKKREEKIMA